METLSAASVVDCEAHHQVVGDTIHTDTAPPLHPLLPITSLPDSGSSTATFIKLNFKVVFNEIFLQFFFVHNYSTDKPSAGSF